MKVRGGVPASSSARQPPGGVDVLPPKFKFHGLRHTYASLYAAAGIDVAEVSRTLGHSKATTTQDIYTHLFRTDGSRSAAMAKLAALAAPSVPKSFLCVVGHDHCLSLV